jgi:hypothetical protein
MRRQMTVLAVEREAKSFMVRAGSGVIILPVTGNAVMGSVPAFMVALDAVKPDMDPLERPGTVVIEGCFYPACCIVSVTNLAVCMEAELLVVWIFSVEPIIQVTVDTDCREAFIDPCSMAFQAPGCPVFSSQNELLMDKGGVFPTACAQSMANFAFQRITQLFMIRISCVCVILQVAREARGFQAFVNVFGVAFRALQKTVLFLQRK